MTWEKNKSALVNWIDEHHPKLSGFINDQTKSGALKYLKAIELYENNTTNTMSKDNTPRVTGIGGIFFKSKDPDKAKDWYKENLGLKTDQWGTLFQWREAEDPNKKGSTQWSPFNSETKYFQPSEKEFMINYRVVKMEALVEKLKANGVTVLDDIESYDYGKFVHIMDNDGNKIELWEPVDEAFDDLEGGKTK